MDHKKFKKIIEKLYSAVAELEEMFPGRHFTPDGHMVGSLGECLVEYAYDLDLQTASNKGFDAITKDGKLVEIKATQSGAVAFRSEPQYTIVIHIKSDGSFEEIYNGPGALVWQQFMGKNLPSNGQYQVSLNKLRALSDKVHQLDRIPVRVSPVLDVHEYNKLDHIVGKHIDVLLYSDLSARIPDRKLIITEVIPEEEKQEILVRYIPYLEGIKAEPFAVTLGDELLFVGNGKNNMGYVYYVDIEFGVFQLDATLQAFLEKLVKTQK